MAASEKKVERVITGMEIDENIDLHIRSWKFQPIAWFFIGLFILLGAFGLFGTGWLSRAEYRMGTVTLKTERFFRREAPLQLVVRDEGRDSLTTVGFTPEFLHGSRIESINPEPEKTEYRNGLASYFFRGGPEPRQYTFHIIPETAGSLKGPVHVNDQKFDLRIFIFP